MPRELENQKQMIANPGDLVFFNGNCWHGASPNNSQNQRAVLLIEFLPKYIKPVEDLVTSLDDEFKKHQPRLDTNLQHFNDRLKLEE